MKIIQIMPEFGLAGAEIMCENLVCELIKLGHQVIIISLYDYHSPITDRLEDFGVQIEYLHKQDGLDISMISKIKNIIVRETPDVVHTHRYVMQYAVPAVTLAHTKRRVHTVHNIAKKEVPYPARILAKFFYKFCNVVPVALSPEIQETISQEYHIKKENIPVIYNGIDLSKCKPKNDYSIDDTIHILHIGRFSTQKNHLGLIEAFEIFHNQYPNSVLQLIGDGELKHTIELDVKNRNLSNCVEFLGTQSDVHSFLHNADIFVLPSNYEGVPMTLIEAMGTGLPIVATKVGGVPDMLSNRENALLTAISSKDISDALCELAASITLRETLGRAAKEHSIKFSSETMAKKYIDIYTR